MAAQRPAGMSTVPVTPAAAAPAGAASVSAAAGPTVSPTRNEGELAMLKVLVPVDGAGNSLVALRHAMAEYQRHHELELHLLNVQPRLARYVSRWVPRRNRQDFYAEQAGSALAQARGMLDAAAIPHHSHWRLGDRADEICRSAVELGVHHIVMGTARKNSLTRMLEDSTTNAVLEKTSVPVEVVTGAAVSRLESWGLPTGLGLGLGGLVWLALD
jgi:nucleotide-binding universal stress UspA family protein